MPQPNSPLKRAKPANCPRVSGLELGGDGSLAATGHSISCATLTSNHSLQSCSPWGTAHGSGQRKGWEREETWESRRWLLKIDRVRATGSTAHEQELPRPLRPATDLPRRAPPHRGSSRGSSEVELAPGTPATPSTLLPAGGSLWPPAPGDWEQLRAQNRLLLPRSGGEGGPSLPVPGALWGTPAPCASRKLGGTHLPTHRRQSPGRGQQAGGTTGRSRSHRRGPQGTGRVWSLPSSAQMSSELPREFLETKTGCLQAASRPHRVTRPELASPPPSPALLPVLPSGHCLLIDTWKQTQ